MVLRKHAPMTLPVAPPPPPGPVAPSGRLRVTVLPIYESVLHARHVGVLLTVEMAASASIQTLINQLRDLLTASQGDQQRSRVDVLSVFKATRDLQRLAMSDADTQQLIDSVMRRDNYLLTTASIRSCISESMSVVALVVAPHHDLWELWSWRPMADSTKAMLETLVHSEIPSDDRTLPRVPTASRDARVFVRDAYIGLYNIIRASLGLGIVLPEQEPEDPKPPATKRRKAVKTGDELESPLVDDAVVVTGTPGVGKTTFLWFLLHQLCKTHTVVMDCPGLFVLFRPDGTMISGDRKTSFRQELSCCDTILLLDALPSYKPLRNCLVWAKTIVVAAPDVRLLKTLAKSRHSVKNLYMPLWSLAELEQCRRACYARVATSASLATLYEYYGGVAWGTLAPTGDVHARVRYLQSCIDMLTPRQVEITMDFVGKCNVVDTQHGDVCHELLHLQVAQDTTAFAQSTLVFASPFVREEMRRKEMEMRGKTDTSLLPVLRQSYNVSL